MKPTINKEETPAVKEEIIYPTDISLVPGQDYELELNIKCKADYNGNLNLIKCNEASIWSIVKHAELITAPDGITILSADIIREPELVGFISTEKINGILGLNALDEINDNADGGSDSSGDN